MTAHAKPKGWGDMLGPGGGGFGIACGSRSGMKGASPYHYPKPSATPKRAVYVFRFWGTPPGSRDPGVHRGAALDPALCVAQCSHARCGRARVAPPWPPLAPERGCRRARSRGTTGIIQRLAGRRKNSVKLRHPPRALPLARQAYISRHTATRGRPHDLQMHHAPRQRLT